MPGRKLLLVGWDGADWEIARPLMEAGQMPWLSSVVRAGTAGPLRGFAPCVAPVQWSTIATGKHPDQHGVLAYCAVRAPGEAPSPTTSDMRRAKALWTIFSEQGRRIAAIGWPVSYPAEAVHGAIVADVFGRAPLDRVAAWALPKGTIFPEQLGETLAELRMRSHDVDMGLLGLFVPNLREIDTSLDLRPGILLRHLAQLYSTHNAAIALAGPEQQPEFLTVCYPFLQAISRDFISYHPPRHPQVTVREYRLYCDVVNSAYRLMDALLGDLLQQVRPDTDVAIVSAHGYSTGASRPSHLGQPDLGGQSWIRPSGIIAARGPGVRKGFAFAGARIDDIAPTILVWQGLPAGADMKGRVLNEMFEESYATERVPSWETIPAAVSPIAARCHQPDALELAQRRRELVEAGLVQVPEFVSQRGAISVAGENAWNLGIALVDLGRAAEALPLLHEAALAMPESPACVHYLVRCLLTLGLAEEAEQAGELFEDFGPGSGRAALLRAQVLTVRRKFEAAGAMLEEVQAPDLAAEKRALRNYLLLQLGRFEEARKAFEGEIAAAPTAPRHHLGLAQALLALGRLEEGHAAARQALALDCQSEGAKAILAVNGQEKSRHPVAPPWEQLTIAAHERIALRAALREQKRSFLNTRREARQAQTPIEFVTPRIAWRASAGASCIVVTGASGAGKAMMLRMLAMAGVPVLTDGVRPPDAGNPFGYFEWEGAKSLGARSETIAQAAGRAVNIAPASLPTLPDTMKYEVIFMRRAAAERAQPIEAVLEWVRAAPHVRLLEIDYDAVLDDTTPTLERLVAFLGGDRIKRPASLPRAIDHSVRSAFSTKNG